MARFPFFHSYIGIQPAKTGAKLNPEDHATGIHHIALWARNRKEVDRFYEDFLVKNDIEVTEAPADYPVYSPGYYAVFFNDPYTGIHFELSHTPIFPSPSALFSWFRLLKDIWKEHPEWKQPPWKEAIRRLPSRDDQF
jgi:catechol 2,3-dioxygenase-like lactoylglutathione lyase family enzyme